MVIRNSRSTSKWAWLAVPLALLTFHCTQPDPENAGLTQGETDLKTDSKASPTLDDKHGGVRITLPAIDFAALGKRAFDTAGVDTTRIDTLTRAWLELSITGADMRGMFFRFPLNERAATTFEIKGIPAGAKRQFQGRLFNGQGSLTHTGTTVADIKAGVLSSIRLYLNLASGSADVCIVIEGQPLPACATDSLPPIDTLPPVPTPTPLPSLCWYVASDSVTGRMVLYEKMVNGAMGRIVTEAGVTLPLTVWSKRGDTLDIIVVRPNMENKWRISGVVQSSFWSATGVGLPMESLFSVAGKPIRCADTVVVPPKDTISAGAIPSASSSGPEVTLCFEMRYDYANADGCPLHGYAKMSFFAGQITRGNILVAGYPDRFYTNTRGNYQSPNGIRIETFLTDSISRDTLVLDGVLSGDRTMAKGEYLRLPSEKKGYWTMTSVPCANWNPIRPDSMCLGDRDTLPPIDPLPPTPSDVNLALKGKVSASAYWENNPLLRPQHVIDGSVWDTANSGNYWLLPNQTKGWVEIDLGGNHLLSEIKLYNASNTYCNDRGTKDFRIEIRDSAGWRIMHQGTLAFVDFYAPLESKKPYVLKLKPGTAGQYVRIYSDSWHPTRTSSNWPYKSCFSSNPENEGAGLNEVQIFGQP